VKRLYWLTLVLALVMILTLWNLASAAGPPEDSPGQESGRRVGLVSTAVECLVVDAGAPDSVSATVRLEWEGQIDEAFLVLSAAGSEGGHSIYVNGRRVGSAPIRPGGQLCQTGSSASSLIPTDFVPIPPEILTKGENVITLTNDADVSDGWTATHLHIEIHGVLSGPPVASLETTLPTSFPLEVGAMTTVSGTVALTSTYELAQGRVITQLVWYQIPVSYTGSLSVPLLIGAHGMGSTGQWIRDYLATEANNRGWLLAAPDMHGHYYINTGEYALAWLGAQYDIIDTIEYMMSKYEVDPSRIYITGGSMGGQTSAIMTAKYPDVFSAAAFWKPLTDLTDWYYELEALSDQNGTRRRIRNETGGTPSEVPFEYQRRSPIEMPQNCRLIPIKMWHDEDDILVEIHHSRDLKNAINNWNPVTPAILIEIASEENECPSDPYEHCYNPNPSELFDYLENLTLNSQPPLSVNIRTDESKPYYWLNVAQTGGDHWSQVQASYDLTNTTVNVTISDTQPLTLAFNLGTTPIIGRIIERPGMGLPATTYLVRGGGNNYLHNYTSGYLTTTLLTTGQFTLTISAIEVEVSTDPSMIPGNQPITSTITAVARDHLNNPVPDGTTIEFSTTEGTFPNGSATYTDTITGGQVTTTLTLGPTAELAEITTRVKNVTDSTSVDVIYPAIDVLVTPNQATIYVGQDVTYTYQITNTGDVALTDVTLVDDNGTPADTDDDLTVCANITLVTGETTSCHRHTTLTQTTTSTTIVTGRDPLGNDVIDNDSTTVEVTFFHIYLPIIIRND